MTNMFSKHGAHRATPDWSCHDIDGDNVAAAQGLGWHGIPDGDGRHRADDDEEEHR